MKETGTHAVEVLKKIETDQQVATIQSSLPAHDRILDLAISQGAPLENLEKWMNLKIKYEEIEAKKAFYESLAAFHREKIVVNKDKVNTQFKSTYSSLGNLLGIVGPLLGKHGLSVRFVPEQGDELVSVECVLQHKMGHTESVKMLAPPDTSGGSSKNKIQQIKSTFTYLRSATFEAVTGIAGTEASNTDDDGNASGTSPIEYLNGKDLNMVVTLHKTLYDNPNDPKFFQFAGSTGWSDIPVENMNKILEMLNARKVAQLGKTITKKSEPQRDPGQEG